MIMITRHMVESWGAVAEFDAWVDAASKRDETRSWLRIEVLDEGRALIDWGRCHCAAELVHTLTPPPIPAEAMRFLLGPADVPDPPSARDLGAIQ